jgi:hypothetical protein
VGLGSAENLHDRRGARLLPRLRFARSAARERVGGRDTSSSDFAGAITSSMSGDSCEPRYAPPDKMRVSVGIRLSEMEFLSKPKTRLIVNSEQPSNRLSDRIRPGVVPAEMHRSADLSMQRVYLKGSWMKNITIRYDGMSIHAQGNLHRLTLIGIGAAVTRRPLPHHRAYGSVHGGSSGYANSLRSMTEVRAI